MEKETELYWELVDKKAEQNNIIDLNAYANGVKDGVQWQAQRLYSEEEVLQILHDYRNHFELHRNIQVLPNMFFPWFEQHKKK